MESQGNDCEVQILKVAISEPGLVASPVSCDGVLQTYLEDVSV